MGLCLYISPDSLMKQYLLGLDVAIQADGAREGQLFVFENLK